MKALILIYFTTAFTCFSQGNFTQEWESPISRSIYWVPSMESNNQVPEIILQSYTNANIYDGATYQIKYTFSTPDSSYIYFPTWTSNDYFFDVNNDGVLDFFNYKFNFYPHNTFLKVINGVNGQIIWQNNYTGYIVNANIYDIDGDGFIELLFLLQNAENDLKLLVISTPALLTNVTGNQNNAMDFKLGQNYPNPFNPTTKIEYAISKEAYVRILFYNELGQLIKTIEEGNKKAGRYTVTFDGRDIASGVYFYQISSGGNVDTKKMILIK